MEESWGVISLLFKSPWIDHVNIEDREGEHFALVV